MAKRPDPIDELADWDPEAPPEDPPDELLLARRKRLIRLGVLALSAVVLLAVVQNSCRHAANPENLSGAAWQTASTIVNIQGPEIALLGRLEGPGIVLNVLSSSQLELGGINRPPEVVRLVGLGAGDGMADDQLAVLSDAERQERTDRLRGVEAYCRKALEQFCGSERHYFIRMSPAAPDLPSFVYLLQPIASTNTSGRLDSPDGQAHLVNARLVRDGKAILDLQQVQPDYMYERMLDCQLAALVKGADDRRKGRTGQSIWTLWQFPFPLTDAMKDRMKQLESSLP
jgi:hypothetical protein